MNTNKFLIKNLKISGAIKLSERELTKALNVNATYIKHHSSHPIKSFFQNEYQEYSHTLDCLIHWNITLFQALITKFKRKSMLKNISRLEYFVHTLITLTNNLIAIKLLFENGLDTQVKFIYRQSIELSDLALVVLFDEDFFKSHLAKQPNKQGNPFLSPKNSAVSKLAKEIIMKLDKYNDKHDESSSGMGKIWHTLRNDQYEILSESAHGNFRYNILNSYKQTEDRKFIPAIGGGKWLNLERTLSEICIHQVFLKRHFAWVLQLKHGINLFDNNNLAHRFIFFLDFVIAAKLLSKVAKPLSKSGYY